MALVAEEGETCWEFLTHDRSSPSDTTKFQVPNDESYSQLYYDIPWPEGHLSTRFGSDFDNLKVLHHWLMFASSAATPAGTVSKNVTGTTIGENTELIAGWAVLESMPWSRDLFNLGMPHRGTIELCVMGLTIALLIANAYLLSREYFEMAAMRHMPVEEAKQLRREKSIEVFSAGFIPAILALVPLVNLTVPLFSTSYFVHIFKGLKRS